MRRRIVITTNGSSGDLHPFLALGVTLRRRNHEVIFAIDDTFRARVEEAGFQVYHLEGDAHLTVNGVAQDHLLQLLRNRTPFGSVKFIAERYLIPVLRSNVELLRRLCLNADILVASATQLAAGTAAELCGVPWMTVALSPLVVPSGYISPQPLPLPPPKWLEPCVNRAIFMGGEVVLRRAIDEPVNAIRAEYGLPAQRHFLGPGNTSPTLTAVPVSRSFLPQPPDWPSHIRLTGFCFWDTPSSWRESRTLAAFLRQGNPVVAISAGSMAARFEQAFSDFVQQSVRAVRRLGMQALLIGFHPQTTVDIESDSVLSVPYAPFSQVYPFCKAVIHHGGIGTVGQAMRAGVPMLTVPWGIDQFFTAAQIQRIGVGRWVPRTRYTRRRAYAEVEALLNEPRYRARAQTIKDEIASEDGAEALGAAVESLLERVMN